MNGAPGEGEEAFDRGREIETSAMAALHSAARAAGTGTFLRAWRRSSKLWSTAKKEGANNTAGQVESMMPLSTKPRAVRHARQSVDLIVRRCSTREFDRGGWRRRLQCQSRPS